MQQQVRYWFVAQYDEERLHRRTRHAWHNQFYCRDGISPPVRWTRCCITYAIRTQHIVSGLAALL